MHQVLLAGGCFWGLEELLRSRAGVLDTEVGYCGGDNIRPTYENHPGHAETVQVTFDPGATTLSAILDYFFRIHDPTTLNRQGNDIGSSYRSILFYADDAQKQTALAAIERAQQYWPEPVVTTVEPLKTFYPAEAYHQDYLQKHPGGYTCHFERNAPGVRA